MEIQIKSYDELTKDELYRILQLRAAVFVVEQNCPYLDVDGLDQKAYHALGRVDGETYAYTRIFKKGDYFEDPSIGRVLVSEEVRGRDYGKKIMIASLRFIEEYWKDKKTAISAQLYLVKFYEDLGFRSVGEEYLEDDIPHIKMIRESRA